MESASFNCRSREERGSESGHGDDHSSDHLLRSEWSVVAVASLGKCVMGKEEEDVKMQLPYLKALLIQVTREPGGLVFVNEDGSNGEALTAEGIMLEHEAEFPEIRKWYAEWLRKWKN